MPFNREEMKSRVAEWATRGVYVGTSSWKYAGWRGMLYDPARYEWRGKFAESRFEKHCLAEYAEVFKTVCVDAAYYAFPAPRFLEGLAAQVPADFLFAFKVTDEITVKKFPNLARFGRRASQANPNFLNADLFSRAFLGPCEPLRSRIGIVMFEFSKFYSSDYQQGRFFIADLDAFLERLPKGWPYGVEIRNKHFLHPEYFACLARHGVTHVFNSWSDMPAVGQQMALPQSQTHPELVAARFLLKPGRRYQDAVAAFSPYQELKEPYPEARAAGAELIRQTLRESRPRKTLLYVNNRLEGNALETIDAILQAVQA